MTKEEFLKETGLDYFSNQDYEIVEKVYQSHPLISETEGKKQIAQLYRIGGMTLIIDMLPRAEQHALMERKLLSLRNAQSELIQIMEDNKKGSELSVIEEHFDVWMTKYGTSHS